MKSLAELQTYVAGLPNAPSTYRIAVGALIFTIAQAAKHNVGQKEYLVALEKVISSL